MIIIIIITIIITITVTIMNAVAKQMSPEVQNLVVCL